MFQKYIVTLGIFSLIIATPAVTIAADWTTLRADIANRNMVIDQPDLPLTEHGVIQSQFTSPVIVGDTIVTSRALSASNRQIVAHRLSNLEQLWTFPLGAEAPNQLTVHEGTIYFGLITKPIVFALELETGVKRWQTSLPNEFRVTLAPMVIDNYVFATGLNSLYRLGTDGQFHWGKLYTIRSSMATDSEGLYLRLHHQRLVRLNPETGSEIWSFATNATTGTEPIVTGDTIYIGVNQIVYAIDKLNGTKRWSVPAGGVIFGNIASVGDRIIYSTNLGNLSALKKSTGETIWNINLNPGTSAGGSTPLFLVAGDRILAQASLTDHALINAIDGSTVKRELIVAPAAQFQAVSGERILINELSGGAWFKTHVLTATSWSKSTLEQPTETPKEINPVVVIPGILGSWPINGQWTIDPVFKVYDGLLAGLREAGYVDNETLFTFPYDWHVSNKLTGEILHAKINELKMKTGANKVDIVAHSMGGLAARSYIQGPTYENDVDDFIMLGVPNHGSVKAYLTWEAGAVGTKILDNLAEKLFAYEAYEHDYGTNVTVYIHDKLTVIQELLPTFDYLQDNGSLLGNSGCNNVIYPCNNLGEALESNEAVLIARSRPFNIMGTTGSTSTFASFDIKQTTLSGLWQHGMPINYPSQDGLHYGPGDDSVLVSSAHLDSVNAVTVSANHNSLPSMAINEVVKRLKNQNIAHRTYEEPRTIAFVRVYSPVDMLLTDSQGNKLGTDLVSGLPINELDRAYYSGNATNEEYMIIPDIPEGEYTLALKGTASGTYGFETSLLSAANSDDSLETGIAIPGLTQSYSLNVIADTAIVVAADDLDEAKVCDDNKKERVTKILAKLLKVTEPKKREKLEKRLKRVLAKCQKQQDKNDKRKG